VARKKERVMNFIKSNFGNFNFAKFKGPRIESAVPKDPGINYVWYWNEEKKMYLYPEEGVKRYRAVRRTVMAGKKIKQSAFFENLDQARAWRFNQETPHYPVVRNGADIFSVGLNLADVGPTFEEVVLMWKKAKWKMFTLSTQLF
jgi:hypothetical protein